MGSLNTPWGSQFDFGFPTSASLNARNDKGGKEVNAVRHPFGDVQGKLGRKHEREEYAHRPLVVLGHDSFEAQRSRRTAGRDTVCFVRSVEDPGEVYRE